MGSTDNLANTSAQPERENILETTLRMAATEPAYRADFYKALLSEKLVVLTDKTRLPEGVQTLEEDTEVHLVTFHNGKIPLFTSTARIFDKNIVTEQVPFLEIKGEDLFSFATGATFILNPYSDYGKELLPSEIESMLHGTVLTNNHKTITVQEDTEVQIGQPEDYPEEIVHSLQTLFATRPAVKAAYVGWIYNPATGELPHLIFALDIEGDKQDITNEAGFTAQQLSEPDDIIDFIQIDNKGGLSDYFLHQTIPFYIRS